YYLTYPGGQARVIASVIGSYDGVGVTADSGTLVTLQIKRFSDIWIVPDEDAGQARQITSGDNLYSEPCWLPDGRLAYVSDASGEHELWVMNPDGSGQKQLTVGAGIIGQPSVSPDGRHLVLAANHNGRINLWQADGDGGNLRQLTDGSNDYNPDCSPDGRWVIFERVGGSSSTLWRVPIEGG